MMATSFRRPNHALLHSVPHPAAAHSRPTPQPGPPGHSWACLGQFLVGSLPLSPGSWWAQGFVCALQESVSSVLCKFWWFYDGVNADLLQEGLCHTQVCCTQSPCSRPLLTRTSTGDTQTQFWLSLCGLGMRFMLSIRIALLWYLLNPLFCEHDRLCWLDCYVRAFCGKFSFPKL